MFTTDIGKSIFDLVYAGHTSFASLSDFKSNENLCLEVTYVFTHNEAMAQWFNLAGRLCESALSISTNLRLLLFWIREKYVTAVTLQD